jgi:hypothetical protein
MICGKYKLCVFRTILGFFYSLNAALRGKLQLAKISDEGAKSQLLFVLLEWLVIWLITQKFSFFIFY